jgi:hypothetical protein
VEPLLRQQSFCAISHLKRHKTKPLDEHLGFGCVHHFVTSGSIMWLTIEAKLSAILWDTVYDGDQNAWSWNVNTCPSWIHVENMRIFLHELLSFQSKVNRFFHLWIYQKPF